MCVLLHVIKDSQWRINGRCIIRQHLIYADDGVYDLHNKIMDNGWCYFVPWRTISRPFHECRGYRGPWFGGGRKHFSAAFLKTKIFNFPMKNFCWLFFSHWPQFLPLFVKSFTKMYILPKSLGAVHKVRHAIFGQFWPSPSVTLSHIPGPPKVRHTSRTHPPDSSSTNPDKSPLYKFSQLFVGVLVRGFRQEIFWLEGFVRGGFCPFPLLSE